MKKNPNFEEVIDYFLTYMSLATLKPNKVRGGYKWQSHIPNVHFDAAEPFLSEDVWPGLFHAEEKLRSEGAPERLFTMDAGPRDIWPIDITILHDAVREDGSPGDIESEGFRICRHRSVSLRELRGQRILSPYVIEKSHASVTPDGNYTPIRGMFHYSQGGWWDYGIPGEKWRCNPYKIDGEKDTSLQISFAIAFTRYYEWTVTLGYEGYPSLCFATDPHGAMGAFRLRDIPEGASRRAALRHWVRDHWRRKRNSPEDSKVRQHLRGTNRFAWNGLQCIIRESAFDIKKNTPQSR